MKKTVRILTAVLLILCLTGCGITFAPTSGYISSYRATLLIRSETSRSAHMDFSSLDGRMVFHLTSGGSEMISGSASLKSGNATVFYDADGTKTEWFTVSEGEEISVSGGPFERGTVYIIIETSGKCKGGSFRFDVR